MRKFTVIICILALAITGIMYYAPTILAHTDTEVRSLVRQVAQDFRAETGYQKICHIDGQQVSLGGLMYALILQEGGSRDGTAGHRTNNRGSLHKAQGIKRVTGTSYIDGTGNRPSYESPYDGLYELAHMITKESFYYKCNIGYNTLRAYIKGPNAPHTAEGDAYVGKLYSNLLNRAKQYDGQNGNIAVTETSGETIAEQKVAGRWFNRAQTKQDEVHATEKRLVNLKNEAVQYWSDCKSKSDECKH